MSESKPVASFSAQMVALGDANSIDLSEHNYEDTALLVLLAPITEVRKAAPLFRATSDFNVGPLFEAAPALLAAVKNAVLELAPEDCNWCGERNEKCACKEGKWFRDLRLAVAKAEQT